MPNNFKLTGDYYVSVDGSDSNNGLTKDTPKRTIQAGLNLATTTGKTIIIGTGVYNESISIPTASAFVSIKGDGEVWIDGLNNKAFSTNSSVPTFTSVNFRGFTNSMFFSGASGSLDSGGPNLISCKIVNCSTIAPTYQIVCTSCIFINCNFSYGGNGASYGHRFYYCILVNCISYATNIFLNSYSNANSLLSTLSIGSFNYNNIQGSIVINAATGVTTGTYQDVYGRYYNLTLASGGDGSVGNPFGRAETSGKAFSYANHRILYPTFNANSISLDPKFNNIQAQDFTLQADSPHIGRASDGISNIGGTNYAIRHAATGTVFFTNAVSVTNLAFIGRDYTISGGTTGTVIGAPIQLGTSLKVVQKITYNGLLEFNKALGAGPVVGNRNVPDNYVYGTGTQGANPDRLVYELRYSTQVTEPANDSQWDNGGYITAGNYFIMEWNTKPSFDTAFLGNGDPAFNAAATPTFINATWIQLKVTLRNNYV